VTERNLQPEKQDLQITSTESGMTMLLSPLRQNALSSIRRNFEDSSNVTKKSDLHSKKQDSLIISILESIASSSAQPKKKMIDRPDAVLIMELRTQKSPCGDQNETDSSDKPSKVEPERQTMEFGRTNDFIPVRLNARR
jgi:hypothetical protein